MLIPEQNVVRRRKLVQVCQDMLAHKLVRGTAGNASVRADEGILVTPTGIPYNEMKPSDIVKMDMDGHKCKCDWLDRLPGNPTSEWQMHLSLLKAYPDMNAVLHTHPRFATTLAVLERPIPAIHYMVGIVNGNEVPCAPYRTFGTKEISEIVVETMGECRACLMAHHGLIVVATDLSEALHMTIEVESLAEIYWRSCAIGDPKVLDAEEMKRVREKFASIHFGPR